MGMGKKKSAPAQPATPPPQIVESKNYEETNAAQNANAQARVDSNESATLLQTKDDEELKRQGMAGVA